MSALQMELGLPQFVGAAQIEFAGAGRVQHIRQATRVNGIAFDQKNLQWLARHCAPIPRGLRSRLDEKRAEKGP